MHKREIGQTYCYRCMDIFQIKLYVLLDLLGLTHGTRPSCLNEDWDELQDWWNRHQNLITAIASASDRLAFEQFCHGLAPIGNSGEVQTRHPISGEPQTITSLPNSLSLDLTPISSLDAKAAFFWLWRFFPQQWAEAQNQALLYPADLRMPDCPLHSYINTVTAVAGAMYLQTAQTEQPDHPHLFLFTFSPVQEFIKSSRKFLDFWAGSYMLHYLGAHLCWQIAHRYGPDAVITPSLWDQDIIDAFLCRDFESFVRAFPNGLSPGDRFIEGQSTSLVTAGFPNIITALLPSKVAAEKLGSDLQIALIDEWKRIGIKVRETIKQTFTKQHGQAASLWEKIGNDFGETDDDTNPYWVELQKLLNPDKQGCWEWNPLWDAQLDHTWESYWVVLPLGSNTPSQDKTGGTFDPSWIEEQNKIARPRTELPSPAEQVAYEQLNVGTWWGSLQARLGQAIQASKNTRTSKIPAAPGERSTLSGQGSALHPRLCYRKLSNGKDFREGGGLPAGSMRLFWRLMAEIFPGCFNGSEKLNALELTKRLAWREGGVAAALGIEITAEDYDQLIRFPNLSSIAAARFMHDHPETTQQYYEALFEQLPPGMRRAYVRKAFRNCQVPKTDQMLCTELRRAYNGVIFSAKWLAEDLKLREEDKAELYLAVGKAHQEVKLTNGSPADWWVLLKADGDGMGKYISGRKLQDYQDYILDPAAAAIRSQVGGGDLLTERKRMGPSTHVGLNRALLDFSNRLVPYLAQQRCCGKVIYSGGDDVLVALPLADLPNFLLSLRAAWGGGPDLIDDPQVTFTSEGGYWQPKFADPKHHCGLPNRPLFTMGKGATLSAGMVIAHKSVPLPTVLESIWAAEADRAKELPGGEGIPAKDGLCFRVIYGSGNTLEALMKGHLLPGWWQWMQAFRQQPDLVPILHRLAEELPQRAVITPKHRLISKAAGVILSRREKALAELNQLLDWLNDWEDWALAANHLTESPALGTTLEDLAAILRFSAFWASHSDLLVPPVTNSPEPVAVGSGMS
jgi:CRISPR-associated protein Cmr2